jgi:hypothetical protein
MIRFVRTASVAPGKLGNALEFAKKISAFLAKEHGVHLEVMVPIGGNPHRIAWRTEYPDLATMEKFNAKSMADPKYLKLLSEGGENFIAGSVNDAIWRTM